MTCKYCVIEHDRTSRHEKWLAVHAVFYDENGQIVGYSQEPERCQSGNIEDLRLLVDMMRKACEDDVLVSTRVDAFIGKRRKRSERGLKQKPGDHRKLQNRLATKL